MTAPSTAGTAPATESAATVRMRLLSERSAEAERSTFSAGDVRGKRHDEDHEPTVEAVQPPIPGSLDVADEDHLECADERERERPANVPPLSPPRAERHQEDEHLCRVDDRTTDDLVCVQRPALAEHPRRDEVELQHDPDQDDDREHEADPYERPPHVRDSTMPG